MSRTRATTDHDEIRRWAEARGGRPARAVGIEKDDDDFCVLRIEFDDATETLEPATWDAWFEAFDEEGLALVYQEENAEGETSRFNKLVARDAVRHREPRASMPPRDPHHGSHHGSHR